MERSKTLYVIREVQVETIRTDHFIPSETEDPRQIPCPPRLEALATHQVSRAIYLKEHWNFGMPGCGACIQG
jgi:hypothetical protein